MIRTLTLLLVARVCAEWVEISQNHYRKPLKTSGHFTTDQAIQVGDPTRPWSYNNHSVTEYNWSKSPANTNIGNMKRKQLVASTRRPYEDENTDLYEDDYEIRPQYGPTRTTIEFNEQGKQKGIIVKVPNMGSIKRVQLSNTPVKSPVINFKGDKEKTSNYIHKSTTPEYEQTEVHQFAGNQKSEINNRRIYVHKVQQPGTDMISTFPLDDDDSLHLPEQAETYHKKESKQHYNNLTTILLSTESTFIAETEDFKEYETRFYKITNSKPSEVADIINISTTKSTNIEEDVTTKKNTQSSKQIAENMTKIPDANDDKQTEFFTNDLNANRNMASSKQETRTENHQKEENKHNKEHAGKGAKSENNKVKTIENVIKFMRVIADTISRNSRRSFGGKMQYLRELKNSILANIEERIESTWPDDDSVMSARRSSRSAQALPRGHVQFPSSESALMTISFLTFAVFLIKLVLQVIQTYKHKTMMVAPLVVASSGRDMFSHSERRGHH